MKADIAVKGIIFNKKSGRILLVRRSADDPTGAGAWENAGGKVEQGEQPKDALKREIREETGIAEIKIKGIAYTTLLSTKKEPLLIIAYLCETETETVILSSEHQSFIWANKEDCIKMLPKTISDDLEKNNILEFIRSSTN